jgi:ribosomal protein L37AE/L43A
MADKQPVRTVKRYYRPFELKKPRWRTVCPKCDSLNIRKRIMFRDYICERCGWIGTSPKKKEY